MPDDDAQAERLAQTERYLPPPGTSITRSRAMRAGARAVQRRILALARLRGHRPSAASATFGPMAPSCVGPTSGARLVASGLVSPDDPGAALPTHDHLGPDQAAREGSGWVSDSSNRSTSNGLAALSGRGMGVVPARTSGPKRARSTRRTGRAGRARRVAPPRHHRG